jgi:hypothetical protein
VDDRLMHIDVELGNVKVSEDLGKLLDIDTSSPEAIAQQIKDSPSTMFYWGSMYELAVVIDSKLKVQYKEWHAPIYNAVKQELIDKYGKTATTETAVQNEIVTQHKDKWSEWQRELALSKQRVERLKLAKDCFATKDNDMVTLLAYYRRLADKE